MTPLGGTCLGNVWEYPPSPHPWGLGNKVINVVLNLFVIYLDELSIYK